MYPGTISCNRIGINVPQGTRLLLGVELFHNLHEVEHLVRAFILWMPVWHSFSGCKILAPKLVDLEAALVNIEVNVSLIKVRGAGFPHFGFWVQFFYCQPSTISMAVLIKICTALNANIGDIVDLTPDGKID